MFWFNILEKSVWFNFSYALTKSSFGVMEELTYKRFSSKCCSLAGAENSYANQQASRV